MITRSFDPRRVKFFNAIVFKLDTQTGEVEFYKLHNIVNSDKKKDQLFKFLDRSHATWQHVNFYDKDTRKFLYQQRRDKL